MSAATTITLTMLVPLAGAVLIGLTGRWPNLREAVTVVTSLTLFLLVLTLLEPVQQGVSQQATWFTVLPGVDLAFEIEPLGMLFGLIASFLWIPTSFYAFGYMRAHEEENQTRFYVCFAIAIGSAMGIAFAANLFTLFIFYEILTLSTFPLVTHSGTDEARRAGRTYLGILLGTSIALQLLAIIWTWTLSGTLDFVPGGILRNHASDATIGILLALYVFGIGKAAVMPFHRWLPAAMVAPTPVSALLHAVAVVKAGVFTVLKVTIYVFGIDLLHELWSSRLMMYAAAITLVLASLIALRQDNLKRRLAYSTVSQLSYIVLGAMLATSAGITGGAMHIATHAFGKITLFFCAGAIIITAHKTEVSQLDGIGRVMPFTMAAFLIGSLSIIGLPPMAGLWSKWYLLLGTYQAGDYVLLGALLVGSLLSAGYLLPVVVRAFFRPPAGASPGSRGAAAVSINEAPLVCVIPLLVTAGGCIALFLWPQPLYQLVRTLGGG